MRVLTFQYITDDRFEENIEKLIEDRIKLLKEKLDLEGITFISEPPFMVDFGTNKQYRASCYIKKKTNKISWNNVYKIINSIEAVPYKFINI